MKKYFVLILILMLNFQFILHFASDDCKAHNQESFEWFGLERTIWEQTSIESVAWSPDGSNLAFGSNDNAIKIYETSSWKIIQRLTGHTNYIRTVSWSPDGSKLASGESYFGGENYKFVTFSLFLL